MKAKLLPSVCSLWPILRMVSGTSIFTSSVHHRQIRQLSALGVLPCVCPSALSQDDVVQSFPRMCLCVQGNVCPPAMWMLPCSQQCAAGCPCYLSRPSGLMAPSSDLGSGDSELHEVLLHSSRVEQLEGLATQRPATNQKLLMLLSVQFSRALPTSCVL